jgi:cobalamin biosynthesis protein CbiD
MAIPNGAGGYQFNDGNTGEALLFVQGAPTALTAGATATAAQLANGLFTFNGTAGNLQLPTVADLEAEVSSASKVNAAFDFFVINTDAGTDDITLTTGTGWTIVGAAAVTEGTSGHFRARKTGDGSWTAYRLS